MILFPYAKDIEYKEDSKTLSTTLIFFNDTNEFNVNINFNCTPELSKIIEDALNDRNSQKRVS